MLEQREGGCHCGRCVRKLVEDVPPAYLFEEVEQLAEDLAAGVLPPRPDLSQAPVTARNFGIPTDELIAILAAAGAKPTLYPLVAGLPANGEIVMGGFSSWHAKTPITRKVEIRSPKQGSSNKTIACGTVDEFVRLMI